MPVDRCSTRHPYEQVVPSGSHWFRRVVPSSSPGPPYRGPGTTQKQTQGRELLAELLKREAGLAVVSTHDGVVADGVRERDAVNAVTTTTAIPDLPPDVFEALVAAWSDLLVSDYEARHGTGAPPAECAPRRSPCAYDLPRASERTPCRH